AISRGVDSASKLTKQLLAFSRQNALSPEILRLQDRLPAMEPLLAPVLGSEIDLSVNVAPDVPPVTADPAELELTLVNLALNARDAIAGRGRLRLRAYTIVQRADTGRQGRWVVIEAQDDGAGIAPKALEHVFDPFFTTKQLGQGTGLGLSQVYAFCQRSGGWAEAESALGQGTTIRLFLAPAAGPAAQPSPAPHAAAVPARVLLVEDNPSIAAVLEETLQSVGCTVICQESADHAAAWLDVNSPPDLVLTDVVMPGHRDGLDLARHVRQRYPRLPLIVMTGYSERMDELATLHAVLLAKPFAPSALLAAIASLGIGTSVT
ncbi:MAG TPA: response regulator, partial [Ramlibacter sp.]